MNPFLVGCVGIAFVKLPGDLLCHQEKENSPYYFLLFAIFALFSWGSLSTVCKGLINLGFLICLESLLNIWGCCGEFIWNYVVSCFIFWAGNFKGPWNFSVIVVDIVLCNFTLLKVRDHKVLVEIFKFS